MSTDPSGGRRGGATLPVVLLLLFSLLAAPVASLAPREGETQFAVIASPWQGFGDMMALVADADGTIVDAGRLSNAVIAHSDNPDFVGAAYRAGAWLVLDPVLLRGCLGAGARTG
jgi:hypothetical protein